MTITEILITGYDGDDEVFATNLTPDRAKTVFMTTHSDGCSTIESAREVLAQAFDPIMEVLKEFGIINRSEPAVATK